VLCGLSGFFATRPPFVSFADISPAGGITQNDGVGFSASVDEILRFAQNDTVGLVFDYVVILWQHLPSTTSLSS